MMKTCTVIACCFSLLVPGVGWAQRALSVATLAPAGTQFGRACEAMNRELRLRTAGRLSLRWYMSGVQGDEVEVVRKIRSGRLDGAALSATGLQDMHRPVLAFQLPGMFPDPESFLRAYTALRPTLEQGFETAGFSLVHMSPGTGPRMFSTRAVRTPDDLRAMHPWQWRDDPILPAMYAEAGAVGVPLSIPEVLMGLQTRRIDTVYAPPIAAIGLQWSQHVQFMSERAASGSLSALVFSRASLATLSEADRVTLRAVVAQTVTQQRPAFLRTEADALRVLQARGITTVTLTPAERQRWLDLFDRTRARLTRTVSNPAWIATVQAAGRAP